VVHTYVCMYVFYIA